MQSPIPTVSHAINIPIGMTWNGVLLSLCQHHAGHPDDLVVSIGRWQCGSFSVDAQLTLGELRQFTQIRPVNHKEIL